MVKAPKGVRTRRQAMEKNEKKACGCGEAASGKREANQGCACGEACQCGPDCRCGEAAVRRR